MQEHSFHKEGSDLGGSPEGRKGNPSGQAEMGKPIFTEQVETLPADWKDKTIQGFAENILRLGRECRALADENKTLKSKIEILERQVNYWRIEAECDHGRWQRCLEDLEHLRRLK